MMQFFETYRGQPKLVSAADENCPGATTCSSSSKCKRDEEREFYLRLAHSRAMAHSGSWNGRSTRALFERVVLSPAKLSPPLAELHPDAATIFKDTYLVEFLDLPSGHSEADLQRALVEQLKQFLLELGRDFCFIGTEYPVQVGGRDFAIDLLFFNRALNALVAFELKVVEFEPEHLGKMQFYLEALDRDVKKPHEQPSIGVLLCATKNSEVVEYALSRSLSPALVAEYQTRLPDRKLLQAKLHEFYALAQSQAEADARTEDWPPPAARKTRRHEEAKGRQDVMTAPYRKKLIEVALPLDAINKASAREKSIRHGHPSTLHLWWARRPLAAARAVIFAQMVDDPSAHPDLFPTEKAQEKERQRLFRIIEDLVQWENTTNEKVLQAARDAIWQSWRYTCAENADHPRAKELFDRHKLPAFHDPFAGGGSIPLEAQRLGLESYASDLNPVAVLINKAMIEIPPRFAG